MIDLYCNYPTRGGIFSFMRNVAWLRWDAENKLADRLYFAKHGMRRPAYCLEQYNELGYLDEKTRKFFSELLEFEYRLKWQKLFDTLYFEYEPIENYDLHETEEILGTKDENTTNKSDTTSKGKSENLLDKTDESNYNIIRAGESLKTSEQSKNFDSSDENKDFSHGWNSDDPSPTTSHNSTVANKENLTLSETEKPNYHDTNTGNVTSHEGVNASFDNSDVINASGNLHDNTTQNRNLRRHGNIGVTTSQQMIESERHLWLWNYFDIVFQDVNKILTLSVY